MQHSEAVRRETFNAVRRALAERNGEYGRSLVELPRSE